MKRRYQIFVSSTFADLQQERQRVLHTLVELGCFPAGMEFFPASSSSAWEHIAAIIDDSDYYVLVLGGRYGSLTDEGISYTEAEYRYAVERMPVLAFLHADPDELPVRRSDLDVNSRVELARFRAEVEQRHLCRYWTTPDSLASAVTTSLARAFEDDPGVGWTRGDVTGSQAPVRRSSGFEVTKHVERLVLTDTGFDNFLTLGVQATHPGLEVFYRQVTGTGSTSFVDVSALSEAASILRPFTNSGDWKKYWVHLGRQLLVGDTVLVQLLETYHEAERDTESEHSYFVNHPLEELELAMEFPAERVPTAAWWRVYLGDSGTGDIVDGGEFVIDLSACRVVLERPRPLLGHTYSIEWSESV